MVMPLTCFLLGFHAILLVTMKLSCIFIFFPCFNDGYVFFMPGPGSFVPHSRVRESTSSNQEGNFSIVNRNCYIGPCTVMGHQSVSRNAVSFVALLYILLQTVQLFFAWVRLSTILGNFVCLIVPPCKKLSMKWKTHLFQERCI